MIVMSRQENESIIINDDILVTVASVHGGNVRISIDAPLEIPLYEQKCQDGEYQRGNLLERHTQGIIVTRKRDEGIFIGEHIIVTVVDVRGDKARLGIQAPKEIPIHRQEVYEAIKKENELKQKPS